MDMHTKETIQSFLAAIVAIVLICNVQVIITQAFEFDKLQIETTKEVKNVNGRKKI